MRAFPAPALSLAASLALALPGPAGADPNLGPLRTVVPDAGFHDPWYVLHTDTAVTFLNQTDRTRVRWSSIRLTPDRNKRAEVDVAVDPLRDAGGGGGLFFNLDSDKAYFSMFLVMGDGSLAVYRQNEAGFSRNLHVSTSAPPAIRHLAVQEDGDSVTFFADGQEVGQLSAEGLGTGRIGIGAFGLVSASFANFTLRDEVSEITDVSTPDAMNVQGKE